MGLFGCGDHDLRPKPFDLLDQQIDVRAGHQGVDAILFRMSSNHVQSADANGPGGPEEGESLQSPHYNVKRLINLAS